MKNDTKEFQHPGKSLERFLANSKLSQRNLAKMINVPFNRINEIIRARRGVTADTDLRLCKYFDLKEGYWMALQTDYELHNAKGKLGKEIEKIPTWV